MDKFGILAVDDQGFADNVIRRFLESEHLIISDEGLLQIGLDEGLIEYRAESREDVTSELIQAIDQLRYTIFVFDADLCLSDGDASSGFRLWRKLMEEVQRRKYNTDEFLGIIYTRSTDVLPVVEPITDFKLANPVILRFGEKTRSIVPTPQLSDYIQEHIQKVRDKYLSRADLSMDTVDLRRYLGNCLGTLSELPVDWGDFTDNFKNLIELPVTFGDTFGQACFTIGSLSPK